MLDEQSIKTLIAVVTCPSHADKLMAQQQTWISIAKFKGFNVEIFDGNRLGVSDDYLELPAKTQAICRWATANDYQRLLKIDDDGYIRMDKFSISTVDYGGVRNAPNDYGYNGIPNVPANIDGTHAFPYSSGGAYWLSSRCINIVAEAEITDWAEDRWVGNTLGRAGIEVSILPGYKNVVGTIDNFLTSDSIVLMQIQEPNDIKKCHTSNFNNIIKPFPQIIPYSIPKTIQRRPSAARWKVR